VTDAYVRRSWWCAVRVETEAVLYEPNQSTADLDDVVEVEVRGVGIGLAGQRRIQTSAIILLAE